MKLALAFIATASVMANIVWWNELEPDVKLAEYRCPGSSSQGGEFIPL